MPIDAHTSVMGGEELLNITLCLLLVAVLAIIGLSVSLIYYRNRLRRTRGYLVRYIAIYVTIKDFVPSDKLPVVNSMTDPVTPQEFIQIIHSMLKRMMLLPLFFLLAWPVSAQSQSVEADSVYEFRFVPQKDMFFVPYRDNWSELKRLNLFIEQYRREIADGKLPLHVDGYCRSLSGEKENLAVARLRSNRVKSELILHHGLTEKCFITRNHAEKGDYVTVRVILPSKSDEKTGDTNQDTVKADFERPEADLGKVQAEVSDAETNVNAAVSDATVPNTTTAVSDYQSSLSLRANLLRWATLTPDLGLEWRISPRFGILVNGSWTSWSWDNKNRRYALWEVAPEVRYYIGKEKRGYIGALYKVGQFNYKFSTVGKEGDLMGGGITGGYQLKLNRALALDFSLGLGCIHADYDKYTVIDGIRVRQGSGSKNWWGPVSAGVTLIWKVY